MKRWQLTGAVSAFSQTIQDGFGQQLRIVAQDALVLGEVGQRQDFEVSLRQQRLAGTLIKIDRKLAFTRVS